MTTRAWGSLRSRRTARARRAAVRHRPASCLARYYNQESVSTNRTIDTRARLGPLPGRRFEALRFIEYERVNACVGDPSGLRDGPEQFRWRVRYE